MFVPLALPGEQARVRLVEEKRGYATAEVNELVATSPERIVPECRHFGVCGGCQYQHADYETQLHIKQACVARDAASAAESYLPDEIAVSPGNRGDIAIVFGWPSMRRAIPAIAGGVRMRWFPSASVRSPHRCWCAPRWRRRK